MKISLISGQEEQERFVSMKFGMNELTWWPNELGDLLEIMGNAETVSAVVERITRAAPIKRDSKHGSQSVL